MGTGRSGPPKGLRFRPTGPLHHRWPAGHLLPTVGMGRLSLARSQGSGSPGRTQQGFRLETANVLICDLGVSPRTHGLSLSGEVTAHRRLCPAHTPAPASSQPGRDGQPGARWWTLGRRLPGRPAPSPVSLSSRCPARVLTPSDARARLHLVTPSLPSGTSLGGSSGPGRTAVAASSPRDPVMDNLSARHLPGSRRCPWSRGRGWARRGSCARG